MQFQRVMFLFLIGLSSSNAGKFAYCDGSKITLADSGGTTLKVSILSALSQKEGNAPKRFQLFQNYPNPFEARQGTAIWLRLRCPVQVHIAIYNVGGELVSEWNFAQLPAGKQHIFWNGRDGSGRWLASGIYFLHFRAGDFCARKIIVLLK